MHTIAQAPLPLCFVLTTPIAIGVAAAGVLAGLALLLWGRWAGRAAFLLAGGAAGWWVGEFAAARLGVSVLPAEITMAISTALLALVLTPLLWSLLAASLAGGAALYFAVLHFQPDLATKAPAFDKFAGDLSAYAAAMGDHMLKCLRAAWDARPAPIAIASGLAGGVPFILGTIRLRLATIVMSSICGGAAIVAGAAGLVGLAFPAAAATLRAHWYVLGGAAAAVAVVGVIVQYRRAIKSDKDQKNREGEPPSEEEKQVEQP